MYVGSPGFGTETVIFRAPRLSNIHIGEGKRSGAQEDITLPRRCGGRRSSSKVEISIGFDLRFGLGMDPVCFRRGWRTDLMTPRLQLDLQGLRISARAGAPALSLPSCWDSIHRRLLAVLCLRYQQPAGGKPFAYPNSGCMQVNI